MSPRTGGPLATVSGTVVGWGIPWLPIVIVIGVGTLAVFAGLRLARRRTTT